MKWITVMIMLMGATIVNAGFITYPILVSGGEGESEWTIAAGPPFYDYWNDLNLTVNITFPYDVATYYSNNQDLNYTIGGNISADMTCWYRINTGSWNSIDCSGHHPHRTFVEGGNTLTVRVYHLGVIAEDTISFTIRTVAYGAPFDDLWLFFYPIILILFLYISGNIKPGINEFK